jgi:arylsulfate sulfotransferase
LRIWPLLVLCGGLAGCGDDAQPTSCDRDAASDACRADGPLRSDGSTPDGALQFAELPTLAMNPSAAAPLIGTLSLATTEPSLVCVEVSGPDHRREHCFEQAALEHALPVLGFRPGDKHSVRVTVRDAAGRTLPEHSFEVETAPLPAGFCPLQVQVSEPARMEPGVTLFSCPKRPADTGEFLVMLDEEGQVIWYLELPDHVGDLRQLPGGNLLVMGDESRNAFELDLYGQKHGHWFATARDAEAPPPGATALDADSLHHEIFALDDGALVSLSSEVRQVDGYPTSVSDLSPRSEPSWVVGDVVVVFGRDGQLQEEHSLLDVLDPLRVGHGSFGDFWQDTYGDTRLLDWSHSNAVIHDPTDDTFIVSVRHQDVVAKLDRSGALRWLFGPPGGWGPAFEDLLFAPDPADADFEWPYHTHAPQLTHRGTLLVYDNGNARALPPDPPLPPAESYSRAAEYRLDEGAMTVEQVWQYRPQPDIFTGFIGDADMLPITDNVLVTFGGIRPADGEPTAILREVTHADAPEVVFEVQVLDDNPMGPGTRNVYRAERLPDLYPR